MKIVEAYATKCPCWSKNLYQQSIGPDNKNADPNYQAFYACKPPRLILHSVGCSRASAKVQAQKWNQAGNGSAIAHAAIDAETGDVWQTLRWNMRGWHAGTAGNNCAVGVEMCESTAIRYLKVGESGYQPGKFEVLDLAKARSNCETTYRSAVELFAYLCQLLGSKPSEIRSHNEWNREHGVSGHIDPEHFWRQLGMSYTMNGFRADVAAMVQNATATGELYRIQVGAFRNRAYAEAFLHEVQEKYPGAFIKTEKQ